MEGPSSIPKSSGLLLTWRENCRVRPLSIVMTCRRKEKEIIMLRANLTPSFVPITIHARALNTVRWKILEHQALEATFRHTVGQKRRGPVLLPSAPEPNSSSFNHTQPDPSGRAPPPISTRDNALCLPLQGTRRRTDQQKHYLLDKWTPGGKCSLGEENICVEDSLFFSFLIFIRL